MPTVRFTNHLNRFFPGLTQVCVSGATVAEVINNLEPYYPGLCSYLLDDQRSLRKHVNIFVAGEMIVDRRTLSDAVSMNDEVYIAQALSGG